MDLIGQSEKKMKNCGHQVKENFEFQNIDIYHCIICDDDKKNRFCLQCNEIFCTIDFKHLEKHFKETDHSFYFSFENNDILCKKCDEIIPNTNLKVPENLHYIQDVKIENQPIVIENNFGEIGEFYKNNNELLMKEISYFFNLQNFKLFDSMNIEVEILLEGNKYHIVGDEIPFEILNLKPKYRTGIIYDEKVLSHKIHRYHPENPNRVKVILNYFKKSKIFDYCKILKSRKAKIEELTLVHSIDHVKGIIENGNFEHHSDVYFDKNTSEAALLASGCVLELLKNINEDTIDNGIAIVRPPGHHANVDTAM